MTLPRGSYQVWEVFHLRPGGDYRHRHVVAYLLTKSEVDNLLQSDPKLRVQRKLAVVLDGVPWLLATVRPTRGVCRPDGTVALHFDNTDTSGYTSEVEGQNFRPKAALLQSHTQWVKDFEEAKAKDD